MKKAGRGEEDGFIQESVGSVEEEEKLTLTLACLRS